MLSSLLFSDYRRRVLGLLLLNPDTTYHVRELARLTGTAAGTLHKELTRLTAGGVLRLSISAQRFQLAGQQFVTVLLEQGGCVLGHDVGEAHHTTLFQPTLIWPIRWLMFSSAELLRCSVRWV